MDSSTWERLGRMFFAALELSPAERAEFLARARRSEPELVAEVEALLEAHHQTSGMRIESSLLRDESADEGETSRAGTRAGPWKLVRRLGRGGMGEVWLAERADGEFAQQAAIKLVRSGRRPADLAARFRRERQLLAGLAHPNIARLLDGGTTEAGEPYLAMEYVEGESITEWCDRRRLPVRERLRVFAQVCEAVRFAHANLVVHRDLKPANILVTADGRPVLLDFGIAKLVQRDEEEERGQTLAGERMHTPEYAAPEQLRGEAVTTATDVWGLGLLLYELLCGERPFAASDSRPSDVERRVLDTTPRRMADAARTGGAANRRGAAPAALASELRGDLEAIVRFALRKEPDRRYRSAEQLGADIERYLRGLPVQARPDTLGYRAAKYVRRHRVGVAAGAALAVALLAFAIVATLQARRIAVERDRARAEQAKSARVLDVLVGLFQLSDPRSVPGGDTLRIGDALRVAEGRIEQVEDQPEVQARLWEALASIHQSRSELPEQSQSLTRGIAAAARAGDPDLALRLKRSLAILTSRLDGADAAESLLVANLAESERRYGPRDERVAGALVDCAIVIESDAERLAMLERALAIRRAISPAGSVEVASSLNALSGYWMGRGDLVRTLELLRGADSLMRSRLPADHPDLMQVRHNTAVTLGQLGRFEESLRMHEQLLPVRRRVLGAQTTAVAASLMGIGQMLIQMGRPAAAADSLAEAQDMLALTVGRHGHAARGAERALALALARAGDPRADSVARSVFAHADALPTGPSADVHVLRLRLWGLQPAAARDARLGAMRAELASVRALHAATPRSRFDALVEVGAVALEAGSAAEAESLFAAAVGIADTAIARAHPAAACARSGLLAARLARGGDRGDRGDRAALRAEWPCCRAWGLLPPALAAAVERRLAARL